MKKVPGFRFMNDGQHYTILENNNIAKYDFLTGEKIEDLLDGARITNSYVISNYDFSDNEDMIVLRSDTNKIYRHSYTARYIVFNRQNSSSTPIDNLNEISYVTFNGKGDKVAFVKNNNLYYQDLISKSVHEITTNGELNKVINGHTDWVYEEEFGFTKAFHWSPDGNKIAFLRFDETHVPEITLTHYEQNSYPRYTTFKYPKVGENISRVSVQIHDINLSKTIKADIGAEDNFYIPGIHWTTDSEALLIVKLNRHQNHVQILNCQPESGISNVLIEESNQYYLEINNDLTFTDKGNCFLWQSERDGNNHLYLYDISGNLKRQLTKGDWEVTKVYGFDEKRNTVYFQSNEVSSVDRGIYAIDINGKNKRNIQIAPGFNDAQFSSTYDYYTLIHSSSLSPNSYRIFNIDGQPIRLLEDNAALKKTISQFHFSNIDITTTNLENDVELNTITIQPTNFDPSKEYPLLMYTYSGPGSQRVLNKWNSFRRLWWFQYLAQQGYYIVVTDNRGTGGKGEYFKKMTYLQLGKYETEDEINAAKYFGELNYIDASRIGVFGKSYGGYISSLCILKGHDVFKMAIAAAPVTNWKWYDAIYTERYMRNTDENPNGYLNNSPIYFAKNLKGKYLLVHGLADDNVHFQNTAEMAKSLQLNQKSFDLHFYPNKDHALFKGECFSIFQTMTNFILENL
jgi:dipeptidyl-peptidase-4